MSTPTDWLMELVRIMARLRAPDGCPWDLEQDHQSLKPYLIEETAELLDAIDDGDDQQTIDELGDVLLQVVFHCQIASEAQRYNLQTVAEHLCQKLIRRHPHVFGAGKLDDAEGVVRQWEAIKKTETASRPKSRLDRVPRQLSALAQAQKIQGYAARDGFDWPSAAGVLDKVEEEIAELRDALNGGRPKDQAAELGDLFFSLVNLSRFLDIDADDALRQCSRRFRRRFAIVEQAVKESGRAFDTFSLAELDQFWELAKSSEPMDGD